MRKILITIMALFVFSAMNLSAQNITKSYYDEPMPNVLRDIDNIYTNGNINFIFNELEDFTVTVSIKNKSVVEAIYEW